MQQTFEERTGATLVIEEQSWGDLITKLTTAMPDPANTRDVTEIDITDMYDELGGLDLFAVICRGWQSW